jgi:hypothetical protein
MLKRSVKFIFLVVSISVVIFSADFYHLKFAEAASNLNGRILIQVQDKGQAWYVNVLNSKRYYLGRPDDAYAVMRALGLGISNSDLNSYLVKAPARLAGRILLKVQDKGQAYYVDPVELKLYYLGRPADAFKVMRTRGLGISNSNLEKIPVATISSVNISSPVATPVATTADSTNSFLRKFTFKYHNTNYELTHLFSASLYSAYKTTNKVYTYTEGSAPASVRNEFYGLFLKLRSGDTTLSEIIAKLKETALANNWTDDELLEFTVALIQYIPYDNVKVVNDSQANNDPYFPYETLYLNKGVCSDKTFLAVAMLRQLGYGAAILDFPNRNHTALGVACPKEYSINNSGYCYVETTNYFPFGVIPQSISDGQAQKSDGFSDMFNISNLGTIEIYQKTSGKIYQGMSAVYSQVADLRTDKSELTTLSLDIDNQNKNLTAKETAITTMKSQINTYLSNGQIEEYNNLVPTFNTLVNGYNSDLAVYQAKVSEYNTKANAFNSAINVFYQK